MPAGPPLGNRNAVKQKMFDDALRKFFVQNPEQRARIIENVVNLAQLPDAVGLGAAKLIWERLDGKAKEYIEMIDPDGNNPLRNITVTLVKPAEHPQITDVPFKEIE